MQLNLFTRGIPQINMYTMKGIFQLATKLNDTESLVIHALYSSDYVSGFQL